MLECMQILVSDAAIQNEVHPAKRRKDIAVALASHVNAIRDEVSPKCSAIFPKHPAEDLVDSTSLDCSIRTNAELHILLHEF
jgi:hypothetical protein